MCQLARDNTNHTSYHIANFIQRILLGISCSACRTRIFFVWSYLREECSASWLSNQSSRGSCRPFFRRRTVLLWSPCNSNRGIRWSLCASISCSNRLFYQLLLLWNSSLQSALGLWLTQSGLSGFDCISAPLLSAYFYTNCTIPISFSPQQRHVSPDYHKPLLTNSPEYTASTSTTNSVHYGHSCELDVDTFSRICLSWCLLSSSLTAYCTAFWPIHNHLSLRYFIFWDFYHRLDSAATTIILQHWNDAQISFNGFCQLFCSHYFSTMDDLHDIDNSQGAYYNSYLPGCWHFRRQLSHLPSKIKDYSQ